MSHDASYLTLTPPFTLLGCPARLLIRVAGRDVDVTSAIRITTMGRIEVDDRVVARAVSDALLAGLEP